MNLELIDKTALISGSTKGIGFAIASQLAAEGARVIVNGRSDNAVNSTLEQVRKAVPEAKVEGFAGDLATTTATENLIKLFPAVVESEAHLLRQMYIQGVSTRKVKAISEELCGHSFSASAISELNKNLDTELGRFARRELVSEYPYLIIDARYEKLRENGVIRSRAVPVAIGIDWEGRRQVLGVEMANRESSTGWKEFLLGLKRRGLRGVIFAVSDDHPGLGRDRQAAAVAHRRHQKIRPIYRTHQLDFRLHDLFRDALCFRLLGSRARLAVPNRLVR